MVLERKYGVGIEAEGFILKVDSQEAVEEIDGLPAVEWVMNEVKRKYKTEMDNVDGEEASIHLEVKTGVHKDEDAAVAEVMDLHGMVNEILEPRGLRYVFQPVVQKSFEFMAASTDPDHRSHALIKDWGRTNPGLLYSTAIA
ncbi:hypothetical protein HOK22_02895, partial [Candidatus Peregrinibacteria bacterium]|nr:hypothetical protein [Candidatus Peregrinibacteria bacterium]